MRVIFTISILIFLCSCATTNVVKQEPKKLLSEEEKAYISIVETDGRLMHEKDVRAANATDLLLAKIDPANYPNFVGWVTYPSKEGYTVSFYERSEKGFGVIADVIYLKSEGPALYVAPTREPSEIEISMISARITALENGASSCSKRHNTIVLPSQDKELWDVYVLAATTDPRLVQVGGHVKVTVSKESAEVVEVMPLSKSCLVLDKTEGLPEGATLAALTVSHIVTSMPIAIHPYINLLHDIDLVVSTERGLWMVSAGKIEQL